MVKCVFFKSASKRFSKNLLFLGLLLTVSVDNFAQNTAATNRNVDVIAWAKTNIKPIPTSPTQENTWHYISNPYSISISTAKLCDTSKKELSTIYITDKFGSPLSKGFSAFNSSGGVSSVGKFDINSSAPSFDKQIDRGMIAPGQGILYKSSDTFGISSLDTDGQKIAQVTWAAKEPTTRNRYWLDLSDANGNFSQILVGYFKGATDGIDGGYDGGVFEGTHVTFYSMCNGIPLSIQGQAMPLTVHKYIVLGYIAATAGTLNISVAQTELDFNTVFPILLKDGVAGGLHNIKDAPYFFTTSAGTFNDRFEIHYSDGSTKLSTDKENLEQSQIIVYKDGSSIVVKSQGILFSEIEIYDMQGKVLKAVRNIKTDESILDGILQMQQVVLINIKTEAGEYITKRIIF